MMPHTQPILKPDNDKRLYSGLFLSNKLQVLLISDPTTDKAAAGMTVLTGHFQDPEEFPGLAHFCEHMLFMGTAKYPDENSFSSFLSSHGGDSNAHTSGETTTYHFQVDHLFFEEALDRFAQFFVSPLFNESSIERELQAVESENAKNLQTDTWRLFQFLKSTANPAHPFHKFGSGNLQTLLEGPKEKNLDLKKALLEFYDKYYSANVMKLVILGRESCDLLERWVTSSFSDIKNKDRADNLVGAELEAFREQDMNRLFKIVPVKDIHKLVAMFPLPPTDKHYLKKPTHYLAHLIGHESQGSLLSLLKKKGLANELIAGSYRLASNSEVFKITIILTEQAVSRYEEVLEYMFEYINMLRKIQVQEWVFREIQQVDKSSFHLKEKEDPQQYVASICEWMRHYAPEHALSGPYLTEEYDPELINSLLQLLTPFNMMIHLVSNRYAETANEKEKWYGTAYAAESLPHELLSKWSSIELTSELHLPPVNEFIPTELELKPRPENPSKVPRKVASNKVMELWFKQDDHFDLPKVECRAAIISPFAFDCPPHAVMTSILVHLLEDALNEYSYLALIAGLEFSLDNTSRGLSLRVHGYNQKLPLLAQKIMQKLCDLEVHQDRFDIFKEKVGRYNRNLYLGQPLEHAKQDLERLLMATFWHHSEMLDVLDGITRDDMQAFSKLLLSKVYLEFLITGNMTEEEAVKLAKNLSDGFGLKPLPASHFPERRIVSLENGKTYVSTQQGYNPNNHNSAIYQYYQVGLNELHLEAHLDMLCQIAEEPAFDVLRTKQQLGYIVWSGFKSLYGVLGFCITIQSASKNPAYLDERIEEFMTHLRVLIETMSEEEFNSNLDALIRKKQQANKTLSQETGKYWVEIGTHQYIFDHDEQSATVLKSLTRAQVIAFFDKYLKAAAPMRRKLSVHIYGNGFPIPGEAPLDDHVVQLRNDDYAAFKRSHYLYPQNT